MSGPHIPRDDVFTGPLSAFAGLLVEFDKRNSMPAAKLVETDRLTPLLARHHSHLGGDHRAACSYWTQMYFRTLVVPAVATVLLGQEPVPLGMGDLRVVLCPDRAIPISFVRCSTSPPPTTAECFASLLDYHLAPLIDAVCHVGKLSQKMVWENAAWPLAFALMQAIERRPACATAIEAALEQATYSTASRAALTSVRSAVLNGGKFKRRLCCLRNRIPGLCHCAGQCPTLGVTLAVEDCRRRDRLLIRP